jgi:MFS family permease
MIVVLLIGFGPAHPPLPVLAVFVSLMVANSLRAVALNTVSSKVPPPAERARFMATQSAVQHMAAAVGAGASSLLLAERPDHSLAGMHGVIALGVVLAAALPWVVWQIDRLLRRAAKPAANAGSPQSAEQALG